jgi:phosphoribosylaminoimidazole-succinocarboxamide synthase
VTSLETWSLPGGLPKRRGKVRDIYDLGDDRLLIVATDRISAFDWVLPTAIPDKGRVLTGLSTFWFRRIASCRNHLISTEIGDAGLELSPDSIAALAGRSMIVRKADVVAFECVVRGYLSGSAWREYRSAGTVCGLALPPGLIESDRLPRLDPAGRPLPGPGPGAVFTPATKAETGHDENVPFARMAEAVGRAEAERLASLSVEIYLQAAEYAESRGLILADTKFEWGRDRRTGDLLLIDEVLTPDSSRYWPRAGYKPGGPQPSFDKQFVRDWLETTGWDKASPPPALPVDVVERTREKYIEAYEILTGEPFPWK